MRTGWLGDRVGHPRRPSAALIVALMALVLSVTGGASAAVIMRSDSTAGPATDATLASLPAWHSVHSHGSSEPAFKCFAENGIDCWRNSNNFSDLPKAAFYKSNGWVYLKGNVCVNNCGQTTVRFDEVLSSCRRAIGQPTR